MGIDRLGSTPNAATSVQVGGSSSTANQTVKFSHFNKARTVNPQQNIPKGKARLLGKLLQKRKIQQVIIQKLLPILANKIARAGSQQGVKDLLAGKVAVRTGAPSGPQQNLYEKMQQNKAEPEAGSTSAQDYLKGKTAVRKDSAPANQPNLYQEMQHENAASKAESPSSEVLLAGKTMVKPEASRKKAGSTPEQPSPKELIRDGKTMIRKKTSGRKQPSLFDKMQDGAPIDKGGNKPEKPH